MQYIKKQFLSAVLFAASVHGHMKMSSPVPYGADSLNNSPLNADGSDFPCKLRSDTYAYTAATLQANTFHVGDSPLLSFIGSATHGGGSCQISLTTDLQPSASSKWMVIHSIEGGCPANVTGNLGGGASAADPTTFHFPIPDIAEGRYTLAWTWFNRIGNREMYMNCAPVLILPKSGGGSKKREEETSLAKRTADFPEMFVANINGCTTPSGVDIRFPNPGDSVDYLGDPSNLQPSGSAACSGGAGITATGSNPAATPTLTGTAIDSSGGSSGGSSGNSAGSAATATASEVAPVPASSTSTASAAPQETTVAPAEPSTTSTPPSTPTTSPTTGGLSGACATEGQWNCIDGTSFQRCASGVWSTAEPVAAGTTCTSGISNDLSVVAHTRERSTHIHRRRHLLSGHSQ